MELSKRALTDLESLLLQLRPTTCWMRPISHTMKTYRTRTDNFLNSFTIHTRSYHMESWITSSAQAAQYAATHSQGYFQLRDSSLNTDESFPPHTTPPHPVMQMR